MKLKMYKWLINEDEKNKLYFGPNEEVIKFLSSRYVETVDLIANKHNDYP
jgi:hypothetical protein